MTFDRVRNDAQRQIRIEQIKEAAIKLFDSKPYHEITLADIASETSFTRGNLYKYISSKEEIFLLVIMDELIRWISHLEQEIDQSCLNDPRAFSLKWASVTSAHNRFLKLLSILFTIIENNVEIEKLVAFKNEFAIHLPKAYAVVGRAFPTWDLKTLGKFIDYQKNFAIGLFPSASPSCIQLEASQKSNLNYAFPDFIESFAEFIEYTILYFNSHIN